MSDQGWSNRRDDELSDGKFDKNLENKTTLYFNKLNLNDGDWSRQRIEEFHRQSRSSPLMMSSVIKVNDG